MVGTVRSGAAVAWWGRLGQLGRGRDGVRGRGGGGMMGMVGSGAGAGMGGGAVRPGSRMDQRHAKNGWADCGTAQEGK
uniref:Uncharacterized protein n=1 Tax=Tanacetum cinerariifolium TaxID=118510 RepID=A0A699L6N3_TANCI|nr:hypothetical protein [Tanacetum cinerariifolium]